MGAGVGCTRIERRIFAWGPVLGFILDGFCFL